MRIWTTASICSVPVDILHISVLITLMIFKPLPFMFDKLKNNFFWCLKKNKNLIVGNFVSQK